MERGLNPVLIECDSLQIVKALDESSTNMSAVGLIVEDSKAILFWITGASVAHTRQETNGIAHCLARHALHMDSASCSKFEEPTDLILNLLATECGNILPAYYVSGSV
ncbi:hypothetical protein FF1_035108 [Malus domestica]